MGLATSQVRLLALTSRKADVEMQIQLNSKRKTMLTREATELAKLYYAKLQNSRIQYSTTNGYKDVTYNYLMGIDQGYYFDSIVNQDGEVERKTSDSMILTDAFGRVILSDSMINIVLSTLNHDFTPGLEGTAAVPGGDPVRAPETVETRTITAMLYLLDSMKGSGSNPLGTSETAASMYNVYKALYEGTAWEKDGNPKNPQLGLEILQHLLRNGYQNEGVIYRKNDGAGYKYYSSANCEKGTEVTPKNGSFYIIKDASNNLEYVVGDGITAGGSGSMFWNGELVPMLNTVIAKQICQMNSFYGSMFSAAFNGSYGGTSSFNVNAEIEKNAAGDWVLKENGNSAYVSASNLENLQAGLKSGVYQLVNVSTPVTGGYEKAQGLDYFKTQNYVVEKADSQARETITAWYDAARADLSEKESYWDSEITALSSELNAITTEIDSVKKLREDAISSTFKWGNA